MSSFVHTRCACGVEIIAVSSDEDDIRIAVASHNETPRHTEWRAVEEMKRPSRGPCVCKRVTNSPHTPQWERLGTDRPGQGGACRVPRLIPPVKIGDRHA